VIKKLISLIIIILFSLQNVPNFTYQTYAQQSTDNSSIQDRVLSQLFDPQEDALSRHKYIDIIEARVLQVDIDTLQFDIRLNSLVPINPGENVIVYIWAIDTDQNKETGQIKSFIGSEYNIRVAFYDNHWQGYVDAIDPPYGSSQSSIFIDNDTVSIAISKAQIGNAQKFNWEISAVDNYSTDFANSYATVHNSSIRLDVGTLANVSLDPSTINIRNGTDNALLSLRLKDSSGDYLESYSSIKYFTDFPNLVTITDSGIIRPSVGKIGSCRVSVKVDGILSQTYTEVILGSVRLLPPILILSTLNNNTGTLTLQVQDAYGNAVTPSKISFSSSCQEVATVSNDGLVTAIRPPETFSETPYITGCADGIYTNNAAIIRVTEDSLGIDFDGFWAENIAFYVPRQSIQGFDYQKIFRDWNIVRITDLVYELEYELIGNKPFMGDIQFLINDPGHGADGTVPCGLSGNPVRLGTDVDKPIHNSCMIVAYGSGTPQWGVYFHEMGHNFLGFSRKMWEFMPGYASDFVYSEGLATALGMYSAKMLQHRSSQYNIPSNIMNNIMSSVWRFGSTPNLNEYLSKGAHYNEMTPSVLDDMIDSVCSVHGYDSLYKFFSVFHPKDIPFTFSVDSDVKQATLFVAALSASVDVDLRTQFIAWGFPVDNEFYEMVWNEVVILANQRNTSLYDPSHNPILKPKQVSLISINTSTNAILQGATITISGSLTPKINNSLIKILYTDSTGKTTQKNAYTDINGYYQDIVNPSSTGIWSVNVSWDGNEFYSSSSNSTHFVVNAPQIPPKLELWDPHISGLQIEINGVAQPGSTDNHVIKLSWDWGDGKIEDAWFPAKHLYTHPGTYIIKVTAHQNDGLSYLQTKTITLNTTQKTVTSISCSVNSNVIQQDQSVTVSGTISPSVSNALISIEYISPSGSTIPKTVYSNSNGNYQDTFTPNAAQGWTVKVSWSGNDNHLGASNSAQFRVEPKQNNVGIPGFPLESLIGGLIFALLAIILMRKNH
jgi:hypothetical protein